MDRMHVRVTTAAIAVFIAACALAFGWAARRPASPTPAGASLEAAALFERFCGQCHTRADLRAREPAGVDIARRRAELVLFLESHGDASGEQDRAIVELLIQK